MIVYRKAWLGLHLLLRLYGSALVRTGVWGVVAGVQTGLLYIFIPDYQGQFFAEGGRVLYTVFSTVMALLVIFRQNAGYGRFHEGRTRLQAMSAAWLDAAIKAMSFDGGSKFFTSQPDSSSLRFRLDCVHLFSLLHGVALQFLRSDWLLDNLAQHDEMKLPPWDAGASPSYSPSLLDYFVLRSTSQRRLPYNAAHPIPVVGPLSRQERLLLSIEQSERVRTLDNEGWDTVTKRPSLITQVKRHLFASSQGKYTRGAAERIYQVYYWVHERCRQRMADGGLDMPAPILSNLFASLQKGVEAFEHCRYLCDTPFPFSWAQMLMVLLLCYQFTLPFVIVSSVKNIALGVVLSIITSQAYWALNEVSRELEDPFCFPPNDIPLARLQYQFNERILAAANTQLPGSSAGDTVRLALREAVQNAAAGSLGAPDAAKTLDDDAVLPV